MIDAINHCIYHTIESPEHVADLSKNARVVVCCGTGAGASSDYRLGTSYWRHINTKLMSMQPWWLVISLQQAPVLGRFEGLHSTTRWGAVSIADWELTQKQESQGNICGHSTSQHPKSSQPSTYQMHMSGYICQLHDTLCSNLHDIPQVVCLHSTLV